MTKSTKAAILLFSMIPVFIIGCGKKTTDNDGVPIVDIRGTVVMIKPARIENGFHFPPERQRIITLPDGSKMELSEFLLRYCIGDKQLTNATCSRGVIVQRMGTDGQLPAGL